MELRNYTVLGTGADHTLKYNDREIAYFTKKELKNQYPDEGYRVVGETKKKVKNKKVIGKLIVDDESYDVVETGTYGKLLYARKGYAAVGGTNYVALLKSRLLFIILLFLLLCGLVIGGLFLLGILPCKNGNEEQENPIRKPDPYLETLPDESVPMADNEDGGGTVSMIYTLEAEIAKNSGIAEIYFKNPSVSNHDVSIDFYVLSSGERVLLGSTGLIPPGNGVSRIDVTSDEIELPVGKYQGLYRLSYYNHKTGEKALVASEITDVMITVKE